MNYLSDENQDGFEKYKDPLLSGAYDSKGSENCFLTEKYERSQKIDVYSFFKLSVYLGFVCFGGPKQQLETFCNILTKEKIGIVQKDFFQLYSLCSIIPGSTSTQLLICLGLLKTGKVIGALLSVVGFYAPAFTIILVISYFVKQFKEFSLVDINHNSISVEDSFLIYNLKIIGTSVCQASVALIIQSAYFQTLNLINSKFQFLLLLFSSVFYILFSNFFVMLLIMLICGVASAIKKDNDYLLDNTSLKIDLKSFRTMGILAAATFIIVYIFLLFGRLYDLSYYFIISEGFFRIGSFSFAGGYSIIPLCLSEFNTMIEEYEFLHGYAILSLLPGPILNIAGYMGALLYGLTAGLLSLICIILPGVLIIFALLPFYDTFRSKTIYQHFLRGASSAFIGFIFSAGFKLWVDSTIINPYANVPLGTLNIIICFFLLESFNLYVPIVLLASAILSALFSLLHKNFIK